MIVEEEVYVEHYGVKGMHWGIRNKTPGVSRGTNREASKDAKEFARAKLFYGQGAGTRRKLIKATVEAKSKRDSSYKKAFDKHFSEQDLSTHAQKARRERGRKDKKDSAKKVGGFAARRFTGEMGTKSAIAATALVGIGFLRSPQGKQATGKVIKKVVNDPKVKAAAKFAQNLITRVR